MDLVFYQVLIFQRVLPLISLKMVWPASKSQCRLVFVIIGHKSVFVNGTGLLMKYYGFLDSASGSTKMPVSNELQFFRIDFSPLCLFKCKNIKNRKMFPLHWLHFSRQKTR